MSGTRFRHSASAATAAPHILPPTSYILAPPFCYV
jgi:hypothetical protein